MKFQTNRSQERRVDSHARLIQWNALVVAGLFLVLAISYAFKNGLGNAPDERAHAEYIFTLSQNGHLPIWDWPQSPYSYESFQPPLYYLAASTIFSISRGTTY